MTETKITYGARFIAETLKGYGVTHVFYVDAMLRKAMVDLEELGIRRVVTHSEKAAAYMADGYARISGRAGVCMSQSVGAANRAAGLPDDAVACGGAEAVEDAGADDEVGDAGLVLEGHEDDAQRKQPLTRMAFLRGKSPVFISNP